METGEDEAAGDGRGDNWGYFSDVEMTNVLPHTFNNKNSSLLYIWLLLRSVINRSICFCLYNNYGPIFQDGLENGKFISLSRSGAGRGRQEQQLDPCSSMS